MLSLRHSGRLPWLLSYWLSMAVATPLPAARAQADGIAL